MEQQGTDLQKDAGKEILKENEMKEYSFKINGTDYNVGIESLSDGKASVRVNGEAFEVELPAKEKEVKAPAAAQKAETETPKTQSASGSGSEKKIASPLPGVIVEISVKEGDPVRKGQKVAVLEAMKMENEIQAEFSGTVSKIHVGISDSVLEGDAIISVKA